MKPIVTYINTTAFFIDQMALGCLQGVPLKKVTHTCVGTDFDRMRDVMTSHVVRL